jgi:hypothetical protein
MSSRCKVGVDAVVQRGWAERVLWSVTDHMGTTAIGARDMGRDRVAQASKPVCHGAPLLERRRRTIFDLGNLGQENCAQ